MSVFINQDNYVIRNDDGLVYFDNVLPPLPTTTTTTSTTTTTLSPTWIKYTCNQYISCSFVQGGVGLATHSALLVGHFYKENSSDTLSWLVTAYGTLGGATYKNSMNHEGC